MGGWRCSRPTSTDVTSEWVELPTIGIVKRAVEIAIEEPESIVLDCFSAKDVPDMPLQSGFGLEKTNGETLCYASIATESI